MIRPRVLIAVALSSVACGKFLGLGEEETPPTPTSIVDASTEASATIDGAAGDASVEASRCSQPNTFCDDFNPPTASPEERWNAKFVDGVGSNVDFDTTWFTSAPRSMRATALKSAILKHDLAGGQRVHLEWAMKIPAGLGNANVLGVYLLDEDAGVVGVVALQSTDAQAYTYDLLARNDVDNGAEQRTSIVLPDTPATYVLDITLSSADVKLIVNGGDVYTVKQMLPATAAKIRIHLGIEVFPPTGGVKSVSYDDVFFSVTN